ncbi:MAG: (2Fe-2S)-binding protein [Acidobacteria bacterium]|nr:(2Fe-2S)-binding protein [Acidobacteriota bacterium]
MSVDIKIEPEGLVGIVAEGTYIWDAAKRMGVRLPAQCEGRGECDTCAVIIKEGATLLSSLTQAEREHLSPERLAAGERLACQAKIEHGGQLTFTAVPTTERAETTEEAVKDFRKEFREMPLNRKLATLVEFEAVTAFETLSSIASLPFTIGEKVMDVMAGFGRKMSQEERAARRPAEHRAQTAEEKAAGETPE